MRLLREFVDANIAMSRGSFASVVMPAGFGATLILALASVINGAWLMSLFFCPAAGYFGYVEYRREQVRRFAIDKLADAIMVIKEQRVAIDRYERIYKEKQRCFKEGVKPD